MSPRGRLKAWGLGDDGPPPESFAGRLPAPPAPILLMRLQPALALLPSGLPACQTLRGVIEGRAVHPGRLALAFAIRSGILGRITAGVFGHRSGVRGRLQGGRRGIGCPVGGGIASRAEGQPGGPDPEGDVERKGQGLLDRAAVDPDDPGGLSGTNCQSPPDVGAGIPPRPGRARPAGPRSTTARPIRTEAPGSSTTRIGSVSRAWMCRQAVSGIVGSTPP